MKTLIIQCLVGNKWLDMTTFSENLDEAKEEMEDYKGWNDKRQFRISERTTTVVDEVVFQG